MRFRTTNKENENEFLNGALAGAIFMLFLGIVPNIIDWIEANIVGINPVQAFIDWGTAERVVEYSVFGVLNVLIPIFLFLFILWAVVMAMYLFGGARA